MFAFFFFVITNKLIWCAYVHYVYSSNTKVNVVFWFPNAEGVSHLPASQAGRGLFQCLRWPFSRQRQNSIQNKSDWCVAARRWRIVDGQDNTDAVCALICPSDTWQCAFAIFKKNFSCFVLFFFLFFSGVKQDRQIKIRGAQMSRGSTQLWWPMDITLFPEFRPLGLAKWSSKDTSCTAMHTKMPYRARKDMISQTNAWRLWELEIVVPTLRQNCREVRLKFICPHEAVRGCFPNLLAVKQKKFFFIIWLCTNPLIRLDFVFFLGGEIDDVGWHTKKKGKPFDHALFPPRILDLAVPTCVRFSPLFVSLVSKQLEQFITKWHGRMESWGLAPRGSVMSMHPTVSQELLPRIGNGTIRCACHPHVLNSWFLIVHLLNLFVHAGCFMYVCMYVCMLLSLLCYDQSVPKHQTVQVRWCCFWWRYIRAVWCRYTLYRISY